MDFELEDHQKQFGQAVREALRGVDALAAVRTMSEGDMEAAKPVWTMAVDAGWVSVATSDEAGGGGGSALDLVVAAEAAGSFVAPIPLGWHGAAARALSRSPDCPDGLVEGTCLVDVALPAPGRPPGDLIIEQGRVTGRVLAVPAIGQAEFIAVGYGDDLLLVSPNNPGHPQPTLDYSRPLVSHTLNAAPIIASAPGAIPDASLLITTCAAAEFVGALDALLSTAVEYARTREQFGQPIGSFQAVQHLLVDCLIDLEPARNLTYFASYALDAPELSEKERRAATFGAYVLACEALRDGGERVIQVFGGIGYTWECDAHLYWRRALGAPSITGPISAHLREYATAYSLYEVDLATALGANDTL